MLEKVTELRFERITPQPIELPERGPVNLVLRGPKGLKGDPGDPEDITPAAIGAATAAGLSAETAARAAHEARNDNPHGVTAGQVGAPTLAALQDEITARTDADALKADKATTYTKAEADALVANAIAGKEDAGTAEALVEAHESAADPHPQYRTLYIQETQPTAPGPYLWWETDETGEIVDLVVNDGAP